jgi:threonylcarbamoyladenosine tRNA methylthiotransferase MtaB
MPQVARAEVKRRAERLRAAGWARHEAFLAAEAGARREVLVEKPHFGRSEHFAEVVFADPAVPGEIVAARLGRADGLRLTGTRIQ